MEKTESDSGKSREEQMVGDGTRVENSALAGLPDPDAGLSEEERAKIVCEAVGRNENS